MRMRVHRVRETIHHPRRALDEAELQDSMMKMSIRGTEYSF